MRTRRIASALAAAGYTILRSEIDPADSEVVFRNAKTTGQVAMTQECKSRVRLRSPSGLHDPLARARG